MLFAASPLCCPLRTAPSRDSDHISAVKMGFQLLLVAALSAVATADATTSPIATLPDYLSEAHMDLAINAPEGGGVVNQFNVYPLTVNMGLNNTEVLRSAVHIEGSITTITAGNYDSVPGSQTVAYLSCDEDPGGHDNSYIFNQLVRRGDENKFKAILLYSLHRNGCALEADHLPYTSIFTMGSSQEAYSTATLVNQGSGATRATISAGAASNATAGSSERGGSNSAIAMSILYSITGLITLLFLVIILTGAVRAHRYPERYGPRAGFGGRPRQSRAKGLARAVLDTLPIVKFGQPAEAKADPALELDKARSRTSLDPEMGTISSHAEHVADQSRREKTTALDETSTAADAVTSAAVVAAPVPKPGPDEPPSPEEDNPGCSICTEDFTVGEDVRMLPCNHKFHPPCIDPWLVNISGTCPLCRLDLRPQADQDADANAEDSMGDSEQLPPPLEADVADHPEGGSSSTQRRRASRLLDFHRLRHATVEERIEILRRHRSQQLASGAQAGEGEGEVPVRRARLTDRLRDSLRIGTRVELPDDASGGTAPRTSS